MSEFSGRIAPAIARHRELALGVAFAATAGWELIEFLALEASPFAGGPLTFALHSIQVALVVAVTWVVIRAGQARTRHEDALARLVEKVVVAREEERRRVAYEVHDGLAPLIVSAKQHLDTARAVASRDPDRAAGEAVRAAERLQAAIAETRRVLQALRPSAVETVGLVEAIRATLEQAGQEAGWRTRFVDGLGDARVPPAVETATFRILQESLVNARRHARSTRVEVELTRRQHWLHLEVRDDGVGFGANRESVSGEGLGLGLAAMRERAHLLGGTCQIESPRGGGTSVSVALPLGPVTRDDR